MSYTAERAQSIDFSDSYLDDGISLIVKKDSTYAAATSIADFAGTSVLGQKDTFYDDVIDQIPNVNHMTPVATIPNVVENIEQGTCDAITFSSLSVPYLLEDYPDLVEVKFADGKGFTDATNPRQRGHRQGSGRGSSRRSTRSSAASRMTSAPRSGTTAQTASRLRWTSARRERTLWQRCLTSRAIPCGEEGLRSSSTPTTGTSCWAQASSRCSACCSRASPRSSWSFLAHAFAIEFAMYYVLVAWLLVAAVALVTKIVSRDRYEATSPFAKPVVRRVVRHVSYVVWGIVLVLVVDRVVLGIAATWEMATTASSRPTDSFASALYMLWQGRQIFLTGIATTIELAVFGTIIAFFLALLLVFLRIQKVDRPDNDLVRFLKVVGSDFAKVYSTVVRGTPMMVQAGIIYFGGFGIMRGTGLSTTEINGIWSTFAAGLVTISLNSTAYMMEVLRGGIESVDGGQTEAARSLGPLPVAGDEQGRLSPGYQVLPFPGFRTSSSSTSRTRRSSRSSASST